MPALNEFPLFHTAVTASEEPPRHWGLVLPGIFGRGRNWTTVARRAAEERPAWGFALLDLRNHGRSPDRPPPHTLTAVADDVVAFARTFGTAPRAVLGHSFGGKVTLELARRPAWSPLQAWVVDSMPGRRLPPAGSALGMIATIRSLPDRFDTRERAIEHMVARGEPRSVGAWMASNLELDAGSYRWRLDFDVMEQLLRSYFETDAWGVVDGPPAGVTLHVIKAEESSTLTEESCERIQKAGERSGRVFLHRVAGGHWVNTDNPDGLIRLLVEHLP